MTETRGRPRQAAGQLVIVLRELSPQHPPCFRDQEQWIEWLSLMQQSENRCERPLDSALSTFNTGINFCIDCEAGAWRHRMKREKRCQPKILRGPNGQDGAR